MALTETPGGGLEDRLARIPFGPDLWLVPIRHHSPACALHLQGLIRRLKPQRILIEGPADATALIPHLGAKDAKPPLALYCFHTPAGSPADSEPDRYRCFYPFVEFSPEWVAVREGLKRGADVRFIDLPYAGRIGLSERHRAELGGEERSLAEDRLLQESWATDHLVERSGCRDFNEWWDRYFESGATVGKAEDFFRNLQRWCLLLRPEEDPGDSETASREQAMAAEVRTAQASGDRCLVVTGGYHSEGIARLLKQPRAKLVHPGPSAGEQGNYLIPYSLSRLDAANGYAAGMADVSYYQELWRQRRRAAPHAETIRATAARVGRRMRNRGDPVTLPDTLEATLLAHRLAALRGCPPGRPELFDAMESAYSKELQYAPDAWRQTLRELAAEERRGRTPRGYPVAPLVEDFRLRCRHFRLPGGAREERQRHLDIYRSQRHREVSRFLHQLRFLGVPYAEWEAGPDFAAGSGLDRVRETWLLRWRPETEAALTERSVYGGQVREAALNYLGEQLDQGRDDPASLLLAALQMGLRDLIGKLLQRLSRWLGEEGDFVVLTGGLARLHLAYGAQHLLEAHDSPALHELLEIGFRYACRRLSWLGAMEPERDAACADALGQLNGLVREDAGWCDLPLFGDTLREVASRAPAPILSGRAAGILTARGLWERELGVACLERAMCQGEMDAVHLGGFLLGFLPAARALVLQEPRLIEAMSKVLLQWDEEVLLGALPHLRLAFTALKPREAAALGALIAQLLERGDNEPKLDWSEHDRAASKRLHERTRQTLETWGFIDAQ